jgi:hypothetical protein
VRPPQPVGVISTWHSRCHFYLAETGFVGARSKCHAPAVRGRTRGPITTATYIPGPRSSSHPGPRPLPRVSTGENEKSGSSGDGRQALALSEPAARDFFLALQGVRFTVSVIKVAAGHGIIAPGLRVRPAPAVHRREPQLAWRGRARDGRACSPSVPRTSPRTVTAPTSASAPATAKAVSKLPIAATT